MSDYSESKPSTFIKIGMAFKNKRFGDKVYVTDVKTEADYIMIEFQAGFEMESLPEKIFLDNYIRVLG